MAHPPFRKFATSITFLLVFGVIMTQGRFIVRADDSPSPPSTTTDTIMTDTTTDSQSSTGVSSTSDSVTAPDTPDITSIPTDTTVTNNDMPAITPPAITTPTVTPPMSSDATIAAPNDTDASADTGTVIVTGNAAAVANVSNVVNTNITDSQGFLSLINLFEPYIGNIDLSNLDFQSSTCSACSVNNLAVSNVNSSTVTNNVTVTADTGDNAIQNSGDATILTGDAAAVANVVNVVNTNITNSNYLLFVLNNFSAMQGDLVLPGESFFNDFLNGGTGGGTGGVTTIANSNSSTIGNNVNTDAATGGNSASGSGPSTITTGDAGAISNVVNVANTNITESNQVFLLVRVFGTWNGSVFDTPSNLAWQETPDGILLAGSGVSNICVSCGGTMNIQNTNSANVENNVQVYALTGNNEIADANGTATINTGNAVAASNVINLVNTNIVGQNVLLGIMNVFGDWQGNLAFGQPDLWVGTKADVSENPLVAGSEITYHVTVANRGNANATDIALQAGDNPSGMTAIDDPGGGTADGSAVTWQIPELDAGNSLTFTYTEHVQDSLSFSGQTPLTETASAVEHEDDANPNDNTDSVALVVQGNSFNNNGIARLSHLIVQNTNNANATVPRATLSPTRFISQIRTTQASQTTSASTKRSTTPTAPS